MYDLLYISKPDLEEAAQKELTEKIKALIESGGGKVVKTEAWGKRELATLIAKNTHGHYVLLQYEGPGTLNKEITSRFKINENILRYMITISVPPAELKKA
ncbi:MAG: 30S ribosomal protein S6 [Candidatus Margulisbacteria bacterium]|jgi:small subunit ribosomal protein S6|nr:30S ribosomal protein S6 [Candidatus Margulisiibacteriota bacterium]